MMRNKILFLFLFYIFAPFSVFGNSEVHLLIRIIDIEDDYIKCNFVYDFNIRSTTSIKLYALSLPFKEYDYTNSNILTNEQNQYYFQGYNNSGCGLILLNNLEKDYQFKIEFKDVKIPIKESASYNDSIIVKLNFYYEDIDCLLGSNSISFLSLKDIVIENGTLINSDPVFQLMESNTSKYIIELFNNETSIYFTISKPNDPYWFIFILVILFAGLTSILGSNIVVKGKVKSYLCGISSLLALIIVIFLLFKLVIPTKFSKDVSLVAIFGGALGLTIGVLIISIKNIVGMYKIERQQSGRKKDEINR